MVSDHHQWPLFACPYFPLNCLPPQAPPGTNPPSSADIFFILYKGAGNKTGWSIGQCAWVAASVAAGCSLFTAVVIMPFLWKRLDLYVKE